jgi:hypothetical protein
MGEISGVTVDQAGNLYFVDINSFIVMKVTPDGTLRVIAGNGIARFSGDGGPATSASINPVGGLAVDAAGSVYLADTYNSRVRKTTPDGTITKVVGSRTCANPSDIAACYGGDPDCRLNKDLILAMVRTEAVPEPRMAKVTSKYQVTVPKRIAE